MEYCVECKTAGTLINCEACPISYHIECLGFKRSPRNRWQCYYCKVIKHGISKIQKIAPKEVHTCQALKRNVESWKERASDLFVVYKKHPCYGRLESLKVDSIQVWKEFVVSG